MKYTGQEHDPETELDYYKARHLAAIQGRFMQADPANAGADPANPQSWNMYSYVMNNPMAFVDPSGMCTVVDGRYQEDGGQPCPAQPSSSITVTGSSDGWPTLPTNIPPGACLELILDGVQQSNNCGDGPPVFTVTATTPRTLARQLPPQQKQSHLSCREQFLASRLGSFVGNKVVPFFSLGTLLDAPLEYAKSAVEATTVKSVPTYLFGRYGGYLAGQGGQLLFGGYSATGAPLSSYSVSEGASLLSARLAIRAGVQTVAKFAAGLGVALTVGSTVVDLWARQSCGGS